MNDNNKMDRGKEHAGPKKMTPRQKQKRNRKATLAAVLCFVAAIAIVGTYTMRDYKTVKKEGELAKAQLEEQKKALEEASQEASGNAQKDNASESGTDGAGTGAFVAYPIASRIFGGRLRPNLVSRIYPTPPLPDWLLMRITSAS